jgi:DNA-binding transcriptional MerR regulator
MKNRIKISDFVKLTGSTLKTVIYYHKIGLLPEPKRSLGGYRLYGSAELTRMQMIKHLKCLGFDLKRIREILGDMHNRKTMRKVLQYLRAELLIEKKSLEERVAKIEKLLSEDTITLEEDSFESPSFQMITDILGPDQIEKYARTSLDLFAQHRKVYGILDNFRWSEDYGETFRALAEFFKAHPKEYQISLDYGVRLAGLTRLTEDDPEVEALALEVAGFIKSMPHLMKILGKQAGIKKPLAGLYNDMAAEVVSPAQVKFGKLLQQYLVAGTGKAGDFKPPALHTDNKKNNR